MPDINQTLESLQREIRGNALTQGLFTKEDIKNAHDNKIVNPLGLYEDFFKALVDKMEDIESKPAIAQCVKSSFTDIKLKKIVDLLFYAENMRQIHNKAEDIDNIATSEEAQKELT